jgi:hypothetical protein
MLVRGIRLEMYVLDVLSVRPVKRNGRSLDKICLAVLPTTIGLFRRNANESNSLHRDTIICRELSHSRLRALVFRVVQLLIRNPQFPTSFCTSLRLSAILSIGSHFLIPVRSVISMSACVDLYPIRQTLPWCKSTSRITTRLIPCWRCAIVPLLS